MTSQRKHSYLRLHSIDVFVRDQERSLAFYTETLGFDLAFDAEVQPGRRWIGVAPPDGNTLLTLIQPEPDSPEHKLIGRATRAVFVTEDVTATYFEWLARGVKFRHTPRLRRIKYARQAREKYRADPEVRHGDQAPVWGEVFTRFEDIDRNSFVLVSFDEVNKAIEAQRRANEERREAERRAAQELEIARQVQSRLFPQISPECRTLEYAGACMQARQVGGDYYDFLNLGQDRIGLVVGDIAGKGIAAALLMANLQANLRSQYAVALQRPEAFLRSVNQLFYESTVPSAYATLFFAEYDGNTQHLRYINCGHLSALVLHGDGSVERLSSTATVLGLFTPWECATGECRLSHGDVLAIYTDGITECFNEAGEEFGEAALIDSLRRFAGLPSAGMVDSILSTVKCFGTVEQSDDLTLIVAKCTTADCGDAGSPRTVRELQFSAD